MGYMSALDIQNFANLDTSLRWHLKSNCYPPIHLDFIPACKKAIRYVNRGDYDKIILMPNKKRRSAQFIVEGLHLEAFLIERGGEEI